MKNVVGIVCRQDSAALPANSIDRPFICDTYHHFRVPRQDDGLGPPGVATGRASGPGRFRRIQGQTSAWLLNHVRAGQEVFTREILAAGFKQIEEVKFPKENYFVRFKNVEAAKDLGP